MPTIRVERDFMSAEEYQILDAEMLQNKEALDSGNYGVLSERDIAGRLHSEYAPKATIELLTEEANDPCYFDVIAKTEDISRQETPQESMRRTIELLSNPETTLYISEHGEYIVKIRMDAVERGSLSPLPQGK